MYLKEDHLSMVESEDGLEGGFQVDVLLISLEWVDFNSEGVVVFDGVSVVID